jgi:pyridoxamine 5'-phosphate oxidase
LFASSAGSRKGRELAANRHAALGVHWPEQGRQVQIRGTAATCGPERSAADFLARPRASRIEALVERQSQILRDPAEIPEALAAARARIAADPASVAPGWTLYALTAVDVEFWQADRDRRHVRLTYRREAAGWSRERLWP